MIILVSKTEQHAAPHVKMVWKKKNEDDSDDNIDNDTGDDTNHNTDDNTYHKESNVKDLK